MVASPLVDPERGAELRPSLWLACLPSCHPDSVPDVSERIIWATLRPRIAPSWKITNAVPFKLEMIARGLLPEELATILACIFPMKLVEIGGTFLQQRQRANPGKVAAQRVGRIARGSHQR